MSKAPQNPVGAILQSGYPLQFALEHAVRTAERDRRNRWSITGREVAWVDTDGSTQFADLVLERDPFRLVVECKRFAAQMHFLQAEGLLEDLKPHDMAVAWWGKRDDVQGKDVVRSGRKGFMVRPASDRSEVCVIIGREGKGAQLESLAGQMCRAAESIGRQELAAQKPGNPILVFPIVVTTAELFTTTLPVAQISLSDGNLPGDSIAFRPVNLVRFHKPLLGPVVPAYESPSLFHRHQASYNTVFIVAATDFTNFLARLEPMRDVFDKLPWEE